VFDQTSIEKVKFVNVQVNLLQFFTFLVCRFVLHWAYRFGYAHFTSKDVFRYTVFTSYCNYILMYLITC